MVLGADRLHRWNKVIPEGMQIIPIGDMLEIVEICLDKPFVVVRMGEGGPESYCPIDKFSEKVQDACIDFLRETAFNIDQEFEKE